jgi:hypothetical protein
LGDSDRGDD